MSPVAEHAGQLDRARQEAALFRARYPRSIFLAGVTEAVAAESGP